MITPEFKGLEPLRHPEQEYRNDPGVPYLNRIIDLQFLHWLPDDILLMKDKLSMAWGIEARVPFLDHKLAEFCASLPPTFKIRGKTRRYIELKLAERLLPPEVVHRKKQGFNSPFNYLLADEFKLLYRIFLEDSSLVRDGHLNRPAIHQLLEEHRAGKIDHGQRLWLLCNSEIWYRMYIEDQSRDSILGHIHDRAAATPQPA